MMFSSAMATESTTVKWVHLDKIAGISPLFVIPCVQTLN
jgi:hypothetical protein